MPKLDSNAIDKLAITDPNGDVQHQREMFIYHARRYIKAARQGRMMCHVVSVAPSGMSRKMRFFELAKPSYNFTTFLESLGYKHSISDGRDVFTVRGGGMDMVFMTHYNIIHQLHDLGFLTKPMRDKLAQKNTSPNLGRPAVTEPFSDILDRYLQARDAVASAGFDSTFFADGKDEATEAYREAATDLDTYMSNLDQKTPHNI